VVAFDRVQAQSLGVRPGEEPHGVPVIGGARVLVGDGVGEEGEEPLGGLFALVGDDGGQGEAAPPPVAKALAGVVLASSVVIAPPG